MIFGQTTSVDSNQKCKFQRFCSACRDCNNVAHGILSCYKLQDVFSKFADKIWKLQLKYFSYQRDKRRPFSSTFICISKNSGSARGGSGIPIYPKKNRQNTPKYPKFLQIYPKIIEALNTLYPKLEVNETNTNLVVLPFLAFLQMDCHYFPTITDHKKRPHVSLNGKMVGYG